MSASEDITRVGTLEIDQGFAGQSAAWMLQRCARAAIVLFLMAGVVGVFGGGWVGDARLRDGSGTLTITHARLARLQAPAALSVDIGAAATDTGEVELWVDRAVLDGLQVGSIQPEPASQSMGSGRVSYRFRVSDPGKPVSVTFFVTTCRSGFSRGRIGLADGPSLTLSRFTFP